MALCVCVFASVESTKSDIQHETWRCPSKCHTAKHGSYAKSNKSGDLIYLFASYARFSEFVGLLYCLLLPVLPLSLLLHFRRWSLFLNLFALNRFVTFCLCTILTIFIAIFVVVYALICKSIVQNSLACSFSLHTIFVQNTHTHT